MIFVRQYEFGSREFRTRKSVVEFLRADFIATCAYCLRTEKALGGSEQFDVEHFRPVSKSRSWKGLFRYTNLYWACRACNLRKSAQWPNSSERGRGERWLDPCAEHWYRGDHMYWREDGAIEIDANSQAARYTSVNLGLSTRKRLKEFRSDLFMKANELAAFGKRIDGWKSRLPSVKRSEKLFVLEMLAELESQRDAMERTFAEYFGPVWNDLELRDPS